MPGIEKAIEIVNRNLVLNIEKREFQIQVDTVQGRKGDKGEKGESATIKINEVKTLKRGDFPYVQNVGTLNDALLNFGFPPLDIEIIDSLESDEFDKPLSAKQGKVLYNLIKALSETPVYGDYEIFTDSLGESFILSDMEEYTVKVEEKTNV